MRRFVCVIGLAACAAAVAPSALAGTAKITTGFPHLSALSFTAVAGETNAVSITSDGSGGWYVQDAVNITAGTNCTVVTSKKVHCTAAFAVSTKSITLGDKSDSYSDSTQPGATVNGGAGNDTLNGGPGTDRFTQGSAADGADTINGGGSTTDTVDYAGRTGNVVVSINGAADDGESNEHDNIGSSVENITGGSGNDTFSTSSAVAVTVKGNAGNDTLLGSNLDDTLVGGPGTDTLSGKNGDDVLRGGAGADILTGASGSDTADYSDFTTGLTIRPSGSEVDNDYSLGIENLVGTSGNDTIIGDNDANYLRGGAGDDSISGIGGNDTMDGGSGADVFSGGGDHDTVDYSSRTNAVAAAIDGTNNSGETGEHDFINPDVDAIRGGSGGDTLSGQPGAAAISLFGNGGADTLNGSAAVDFLDGAAGNDTLNANDGDDQLYGGSGNDVLNGGGGFDVIDDEGGDSTVDGGTGPDIIRTGAGTDSIQGGDGDDIIEAAYHGASAPVSVDGGPGDDSILATSFAFGDTFTGGTGFDRVDYSSRTNALTITLDGAANDGEAGENDNVGSGFERLIGGTGNDILTGGPGNETLTGGLGNDQEHGAGGNDTFDEGYAANGADLFDGGPGTADVVDYSQRQNPLTVSLDGVANDGETGNAHDNVNTTVEGVIGGVNDDHLIGNNSVTPNLLNGGDGSDTVDGLGGNDVLHGGYAFFAVAGGGNDTLNGGDGNDQLLGDDDNDVLRGDAGNDTLDGGGENDTLQGGLGDDTLDGGGENDSMSGGAGVDTVTYATSTAGVTVTLDGAANDGAPGETDNALTDVENIVGSSFADSLTGNNVTANKITGAAGDDQLFGLGGNDVFDGGTGGDSFDGGLGTDFTTYQLRTVPVTVTLEGTANDGASGEHDNVKANVEAVAGGSAGDTLTGNSSANFLFGLGGNDTLNGGLGGDILNAGAGNDSIMSRETPGVLDQDVCGPGTDTVTADFLDTATVDCETVNRA